MSLPFMPLLAVDFGTSAIKVAEFSGRGRKRKLSAIGIEMLPKDAIVDGAIQDESAVERTLFTILDRLKIDPRFRRVAFALHPNAAEIKRVLIDAKADDFDSLVQYQAEQVFQTDFKDLYFQYQKLETWSEDPTKVPVLMVGARREAVDQMIELFRGCGLLTGVVDCESLCLSNVYDYCYPDDRLLCAVLDIGANMSVLTLEYAGQQLFNRTIALGGSSYTRQIMQAMAVDFDNAESLKISISLGQARVPDAIQSVFSEMNQGLLTEVHNALKTFFETTTPIPGVSGLGGIVLSGGGAKVLDLDAAITKSLNVPVRYLNPFANIDFNRSKFEVDFLSLQGHVFGVAAGLALRKMGDHV